MRVVLVGSDDDRARLRSRLDDTIDVVGEFATLAEARRRTSTPTRSSLAPGRSQVMTTRSSSR